MTTFKPGTRVFEFEGPPSSRDWLVADLGEIGFGAFEEQRTGVTAYVAEDEWSTESAQSLETILRATGFRQESTDLLAAKNWNAAWEAGIEPIIAGGFCVHPPWHEAGEGLIPICIEPKMSFGTAHHPTTRLVLGMMGDVVTPGASVLDAGTGTGVLAIAAMKLGAGSAVGFDIDPWSQDNALENLLRNGIENVEIRTGGLETAQSGRFDLILANINRGALLDMIPGFADCLLPDGCLLLSGLLVADEAMMAERLAEFGLTPVKVRVEGDWIAIEARKSGTIA
ncbi:MAG: ribosomal protein L11 methyltransferase [Thalassolituus oleivorans]|jgi:ribosomal protein L11 methyltransferase